MKTLLLILITSTLSLTALSQTGKKRAINQFETFIVGDFSNQKQIEAEQRAGKQIHPLARHVNRRADAKIRNLPTSDGFWLIEESYYESPGKPIEAKPYLFHFEAVGDTAVKLTVYKFPAGLAVNTIKNDNAELVINYSDIQPSPTFKPALYSRVGKTFRTNSINDLGKGMTFTLTETLTRKQLIVMELLVKDGKKITPYDTPIIYDRTKSI